MMLCLITKNTPNQIYSFPFFPFLLDIIVVYYYFILFLLLLFIKSIYFQIFVTWRSLV